MVALMLSHNTIHNIYVGMVTALSCTKSNNHFLFAIFVIHVFVFMKHVRVGSH